VTSPFIIHGFSSNFHEPFVRHDGIMTVSHLRKTSLAVAVVGFSMVSMALPVFTPTATAAPTLSATAKATLSDGAGPDVQVWGNAAIRWNVPSTPAAPSDEKPAAATGTPYLPTSTAAYWAYGSETDPVKKRAFYNIGYTPSVVWYDGVSSDADTRLENTLAKAKAANQVAQIALYGIPQRDCGSLSAGGHKNAESYKAWIDRVSAMVGDQTVMVIVEPDAIGYCGKAEIRKERAPLLTYVGQKFQANNPNAALYIHAGSGQLDQEAAADAVIDGGIKYMRGFAMNVSSSGTTPVEEAWAEQFVKTLEAKGVAGKHYVVDTSRNGVALQGDSNPGGKFLTCNNPTAAVGTRPTSNTTGAHADAYVWAKPVGESDGVCHPGDPDAGKFFPDLAVKVVQNGVTAGTIEYWEVP
jgi:cellulase